MLKTFVKMHGLGNDFAVFEGGAFSPAQIRTLADRRTGIGFDQMVVLMPSAKAGVFMRIYNADGSEAGACGNATRCVARLKGVGSIETISGILTVEKVANGWRVDMGAPKVTPVLPLEGAPVGVDVGNPHAVFFVEDVADIHLEAFGPKIENDPLFPQRTNVEVAQVLSKDKIRMRVWERGGGVTPACGTGACATAVAAITRRLAERSVTIQLDGGDLHIEWPENGHVFMTGAAEEVYRGEVDV